MSHGTSHVDLHDGTGICISVGVDLLVGVPSIGTRLVSFAPCFRYRLLMWEWLCPCFGLQMREWLSF